jgi:hypothetical protein
VNKPSDPLVLLPDYETAAALSMWPDNRTLMIACHGQSVPARYFATPLVDTFSAYPHLWHRRLKERFPWAIFNVIDPTPQGGGLFGRTSPSVTSQRLGGLDNR